MLEKYLQQTEFTDFEDFKANYKLLVPENFNFGYDIVDAWAAKEPNKKALLWTNDQGECREFTFGEIKKYTDQTASYFQSIGLKKGDIVMAILKRRYEFWFTIIALHKIGAVIIPATHLLTKKDLVYRTCSLKTVRLAQERGLEEEHNYYVSYPKNLIFTLKTNKQICINNGFI